MLTIAYANLNNGRIITNEHKPADTLCIGYGDSKKLAGLLEVMADNEYGNLWVPDVNMAVTRRKRVSLIIKFRIELMSRICGGYCLV